jgi:hypothetical protein
MGEIDYLTGGIGSDRFILGDSTWIGYDDGLTTNAGTNDYAEIADFNISEGDLIQLQGGVNYLLSVVGADTQLFIDKPNALVNPEPDELIGIIRNQTNLSLTSSYFVYNQNQNGSPNDLNLSNNAIAENQAIGTAIGTFTSTDPDTSNTFTYSLVTGTGDTNNALFTISGNQLQRGATSS